MSSASSRDKHEGSQRTRSSSGERETWREELRTSKRSEKGEGLVAAGGIIGVRIPTQTTQNKIDIGEASKLASIPQAR